MFAADRYRFLALHFVVLLIVLDGCAGLRENRSDSTTLLARHQSAVLHSEQGTFCLYSDLNSAEVCLRAAEEASNQGNSRCVELYYQAALSAWGELQAQLHCSETCDTNTLQAYRTAINGMIREGQAYDRFDPSVGLQIETGNQWHTIPCAFHGFARLPQDFNEVLEVSDYSSSQLNNFYRKDGIGSPTIVFRCRTFSDTFQRKQSSFPATLLLRPSEDSESGSSATIEFYNPIEVIEVEVADRKVRLATDTSAPIARALSTTKRNYVQSFLQPGSVTPDEEGLFMLEPYQAEKIPVVFVHGLLSDRLTWSNVINELYARPDLMTRYQIWGFEYPTGEPFLQSAAMLRRELEKIRELFDPHQSDTAFQQMIIVGHSMGGLIGKLQATSSQDVLWNAISKCPFETITMTESTREQLARAVFFDPTPTVSRIVYIGTPHRGSVVARRLVGRLGSLLVEEPVTLQVSHRQLLRDNPDAFSAEFSRRTPTSVDLLEPESLLLNAIGQLVVADHVDKHSIIGNGQWMPGNGDSDGVVPVSSARQTFVESERFVRRTHTELTQDPIVIDEVLCILEQHVRRLDQDTTVR